MSFITFVFFQYVWISNFCLEHYNQCLVWLKDKARFFAGPARQDYWLLDQDNNKGRVYSIMYEIPNQLTNETYQFHIETNRIHKMNNQGSRYVRLPYISFEYVHNNLRIDCSEWIQSLRISENHTISTKTLLELYCALHQRVLDYNNARVNVITRQGAELSYELN